MRFVLTFPLISCRWDSNIRAVPAYGTSGNKGNPEASPRRSNGVPKQREPESFLGLGSHSGDSKPETRDLGEREIAWSRAY